MAIEYTVVIFDQADTDAFARVEGGGADTDLTYPLYFKYGIEPSPGMPNIASPGTLVMYLDNYELTTYPWHDTNTGSVEFASDGIGATWGVGMEFTTDIASSSDQTFMIGRITEWNEVPGVVEDRVVEVVLMDYMYELQEHLVDRLSPLSGYTLQNLLKAITYTGADTEAMPFKPPFGTLRWMNPIEYEFTLDLAYSDVVSGSNRVIQPLAKLVGSTLGYFYVQPGNSVPAGVFYYQTLDEWIDFARTDHHTFDNQWLDIQMSKTRDHQFTRVDVTYYPADVSTSNEVLFSHNSVYRVKPSATQYLRVNYRDPDSKDVSITVLDTDIVTPVSGTDYLVSYTSGSTDNAASSDLTVNLTNYGSAAQLEFVNGGTSNLYLSLLQVRGKPIRLYDKVTITKGDGQTSANTLKVDLKYMDDADFAENALNYYDRIYNRYPDEPFVSSITFQAGQDSDTFEMAHSARIGDSIRIKEDVNSLDSYYRIMNVEWLFNACYDIQVTFGLWPTEYTSLHMVSDSDEHYTDSNGARFAFWR